jgi:Na+/proline symporter
LPSYIIILCALGYFVFLFAISWYTGRNADSQAFFVGGKKSKWYIVAYGMIGTSLSGVTFMSVPGEVGVKSFAYLELVMGNLLGYITIALVLLPLYYRLNLTSIYTYLNQRFGNTSYKTGSFFFLLSRTLGASLRVFLVVNVLQKFSLDALGVPFGVTGAILILMILLYTFKGGVKTIVWTDMIQTTCMLLAVVLCVGIITNQLGLSFSGMLTKIEARNYTQTFFWDWHDKKFFFKQFFSGMFIAIVMTGLDQEMMQKNLSLRTIGEAKKNILTFSVVFVFVNLIFLLLGAVLYLYVAEKGIIAPTHSDDLFPTIALQYLGPVAGLIFILGLISALYPSADGALTALTTSFCVDMLGIKERKDWNERQKTNVRYIVHVSFALVLLLCLIMFKVINNDAVISTLFKVAGYTYGPLLGLYSFGLFMKRKVRDNLTPFVCVIAPISCFFLSKYSKELFNGYEFGFELLIINGLIVFMGLLMISRKTEVVS